METEFQHIVLIDTKIINYFIDGLVLSFMLRINDFYLCVGFLFFFFIIIIIYKNIHLYFNCIDLNINFIVNVLICNFHCILFRKTSWRLIILSIESLNFHNLINLIRLFANIFFENCPWINFGSLFCKTNIWRSPHSYVRKLMHRWFLNVIVRNNLN